MTVERGVVVLPGGCLVVGPDVVPVLVRLCEAAVRAARRDGIGPPAAVSGLLDAATCAASGAGTAVGGSAAVPESLALSVSGLVDPVATAEVAAMLGCQERNVRDLRARGHFPSARRLGRSWLFERSEVLALAAARGRAA